MLIVQKSDSLCRLILGEGYVTSPLPYQQPNKKKCTVAPYDPNFGFPWLSCSLLCTHNTCSGSATVQVGVMFLNKHLLWAWRYCFMHSWGSTLHWHAPVSRRWDGTNTDLEPLEKLLAPMENRTTISLLPSTWSGHCMEHTMWWMKI